MGNQTKTRLSPVQMRETLLANAKELMSEHFQTHSPEVSGDKKANKKPVVTLSQQRKASCRQKPTELSHRNPLNSN